MRAGDPKPTSDGMSDEVELRLDHVCEVLSGWTGIPVERLVPGGLGAESLSGLEQSLLARIFGQERAIDAAVLAIRRRFELPERPGVRRPLWVALFAGPSGVGKTQLARELATHFFGDVERSLVKVDLSELREEHTAARLVGAPPGYKGHGSGGELTNALRRCRSGVLLLDEVEKAHPSILTTVVLPLIGEGVVHDMNDGRALDVTNMMVILTTNLGTNRSEERQAGFGVEGAVNPDSEEKAILGVVRGTLPREVQGRIDDIIVFSPLGDDAVRQIWCREVSQFEARLAERGIACRVDIDAGAEALLLEQIGKAMEREGARAVIRFFDRAVVDRALDLLRRARAPETIRIEATRDGGLRYRVVERNGKGAA